MSTKLSELRNIVKTTKTRIGFVGNNHLTKIDAGYFFQGKWNGEVKFDCPEGGSFYFYTNIEVTVGEVLTCLSDYGNIDEGTLEIMMVDENDIEAVDWCKEHPISKLMLEALIEGKF